MHDLLTKTVLLADRSLLRDMGSGFRDKQENQGGTDMLLWIGIVVGVFVAIAIVAHFVARRDKRQIFNSSRGLFRALCRAHQLDFASRRLLRWIARDQQVEPAARLFLEPEQFEPENMSPALNSRAAEIMALRKRLFAGGDLRGVKLGSAAESGAYVPIGPPVILDQLEA